MARDLETLKPKNTYQYLLQVTAELTTSLTDVEDGNGTLSALQIATNQVNIDGTLKVGATTGITSIIDDDTMATAAATNLATAESIKAYVDANSGGDAWSDPVDSDIVPDADGTRDLGTTANRFAEVHADSIELAGTTTITSIIDDDTMATAANTNLATAESIKAYVDATFITASSTNTLTNKTINTASNTITIVEADISDLQSYLLNLSDDTTPQLSGSLDVNNNKIVSTSNGNIDIEPNGTGNVLLGNMTFDADQSIGAGQDNYVLTYDNGTGLISLESGGGLTLPIQAESDPDTILTDTSGNELLDVNEVASAVNHFEISNNSTGNNPILSAVGDDTNIDIELNPKGTGSTTLNTPSLIIKGSTNGPASLYLHEDSDNGTNYNILRASPSIGASFTLTLPNAQGSSGEGLVNDGSGNLSWTSIKPDKEITWLPGSFESNNANPASIEFLNGTNVDTLVRAFDDTTTEYVEGKFVVPGDVNTSGTVTFRTYSMAATAAASKNVEYTFEHLALNDAEDFDPTSPFTSEVSGDLAVDSTQDNIQEDTWTETISNLGWAANDIVIFRLSRTAPSTNNLSGDLYLFSFTVEIPRT